MKQLMNFEEWLKFELRIGEFKGNNLILVNGKSFNSDIKINLKKGDKIVVGIQGDKLVYPLVNGVPLIPEKDIEAGSRIR